MRAEMYDQLYKDNPQYSFLFGDKTTHVVPHAEGAVPGYWVRGEFNLNLPGHELFEDYTVKSVTVSLLQDNGQNALTPGQGLDKYKVLAGNYASNSKTGGRQLDGVDTGCHAGHVAWAEFQIRWPWTWHRGFREP